jgi:cytochrome c biogenesis protein ResB
MRRFHLFFSSLRVAAVLLFLISLVSIAGTLIPQGLEQRDYLLRYPWAGHWILAFGVDDLYRGRLFVGLLGLLSCSTLVCTLTRWKVTRRRWLRRSQAHPREIEALPVQTRIPGDRVHLPQSPDWVIRHLEDGRRFFFRASGRMSLLGGLLIHVGLLGILGGGLIDSMYGVETFIRGSVGDRVPVPPISALRAASKADRLSKMGRGIQGVNPNDSRIPTLEAEIKELVDQYEAGRTNPEFSMVFHHLRTEYYDHTHPQSEQEDTQPGRVKNWNSSVTLEKATQILASGVLRVNEPLLFGGYAFYQSDWDKAFRQIQIQVRPAPTVTVAAATEDEDAVWGMSATLKTPIRPAWSSMTFQILDFWPDFRVVDGQFFSASNELRNPMAQIEAYDETGKTVGRAWAFPGHLGRITGPHASNLPYSFAVIGASTVDRSGIQVACYPGTTVVWIGSFLFSLGMILTFYIGYFETWLIVSAGGDVLIAVSGNRGTRVLEGYLEKAVGEVTRPNSA